VFVENLAETVLQDDGLTRMLTLPNVLITAQQAFLTHEALRATTCTTAANLLTQVPANLIDGSPEIRTQDQSVKSRMLYR
jgi:D-lactate dehydrogenase